MLGIQLIRDGEVALVHRVTERLVHIGRAPANDLILPDAAVSEHHAVVWRKDGQAWLRDLESTNGTLVNGAPLKNGVTALQIGDQVSFGSTVLEITRLREPTPPAIGLLLECAGTQVAMPLTNERFRVGSGLDCDLILPGAPPHVLTLFVDHLDVWLGTDEGERPIEVDSPFDVAGRTFVIRHTETDRTITLVPSAMDGLEYRLATSLDSPTGPFALITDLHSGASHRVEAENRAMLLHLLAVAFRDSRAQGESIRDAGWCSDHELRNAIWGRISGANQLNVLIHRMRAELREGGLDPWFIEKRRRYTRARLTEVEILS